MSDHLNYVYTCDVNTPVQIKVIALEGSFKKPPVREIIDDPDLQFCATMQEKVCNNVYIQCQVFCENRPVGVPVLTSYKSFPVRYEWNEWLTLPLRHSDLSRDAQVAFTIYDIHTSVQPHAIGGTSISLFTKRGIFRQRICALKVWPFCEGDGMIPSTTPGKVKYDALCGRHIADERMQILKLSKFRKKYYNGMIEKVDWLDRLTFRQIEVVDASEKRMSNELYLMIEFPSAVAQENDYFVIHYEQNEEDTFCHNPYPTLVRFPDPEIGMENLVEAKHHILARSVRSIVNYPPNTQLSSEEKDLMWKFRYYLLTNKRALTKFLQCVHWSVTSEVNQAEELLNEWSAMDAEDALELLSPNFSHPYVRKYAVSRLKEASVDDLLLYLLQLVQALKFERFGDICSGVDSSFVQQLTTMSTEVEEDVMSKSYFTKPDVCDAEISSEQNHDLLVEGTKANSVDDVTRADSPPLCHLVGSGSGSGGGGSGGTDLATFLIAGACKDTTLANYLYWYLKVECDCYFRSEERHKDHGRSGNNLFIQEMYMVMLERLSRALARGDTDARRRRQLLRRQQLFVDRLVKIMQAVYKESGNRKRKTEVLQTLLEEHEDSVNFLELAALPLPLDPTVRLQSVVAKKASLFNSALMPCKLTFKTVEGRDYTTIFKYGDDLRQDQLVLQTITLMDKLLRKENLDLRLTPYKVLATSVNHGFVQYVDSETLRDVLRDWTSIQEYFRHYMPSSSGPFGIEADVVDNYVRSCAGYTVISYLLGIGDRHLHNLLLCTDGRIFHVDFGYILGRDPKPLAPPIKLTKEMIEGLGGFNSNQWQEFRTLTYTAFLHLRRNSNLILNLFALMINSTIPDIVLEPDKAVKKLQERFLLHLSDEEAVQYIQQLIDVSISAKMAAIADIMHDVAHYLRK
ncbi:unnamed protein product [Soboliphyme baturini]|uniref:Phosphatidylinositol 3-kinase catalytic subunit type 3 n=1 Tax=Soboliphyme baturini TaxID=241478 RepID=A0A183IPR1_9BILA|nr:unnamed protein product [Soboliphyme baturini]